ncbi:MAG: glycosyltransferase, partial [bacterium]|nr:glycosyltransferase [bacterium]
TVVTATPSESRFMPDEGQTERDMFETALLSVHYRFVDDPLGAAADVEELCDWGKMYHRQHPFDVILAYFVYPAGYLGVILGEYVGVPVVCNCRGNDISKDIFTNPAVVATVLQRSTRLIFVSDSLLRMADTLTPCRDKATIVANAVDSTAFVPAVASQRASRCRVTLGSSGVMRWKKGIDLLLPLLRKLCMTHDIQVVIAGYGLDVEIDCQFAAFLDLHGLQSRVELTGAIPHHKMVDVLQQFDFYLNTSYQEGMPNGVLEAMACGLPVVATDADGTPELVQDGVTGYLCKMGDLSALIARCTLLIERPAWRRQMGWAGRQRILRDFQPEREAEAVETVLRSALETVSNR